MKNKNSYLDYSLLRQNLTTKELGFKTTDELKTLTEFIGQERALDAVFFGIGIKSQGYNIFAMGPSGIGKRSLIRNILESEAIKKPAPPDWCYIHNFDSPTNPKAICLPAGQGVSLQENMKLFVKNLSISILSIFESDEYNNGIAKINAAFNKKRRKLGRKNAKLLKNKVPRLYKERHLKVNELQAKLTTSSVEPMINRLKKKYFEHPEVINYLTEVQKNIITHANTFIKHDENTNILYFDTDNPLLINYQINLIVNNNPINGAPVIYEENPSYSNLICRMEYTMQQGIQVTNFTLIKPGSLHKANGGYLIIDARKLKKYSDAWEGLKRALYNKKITIESTENLNDQARPVTLEPVPIPLNVKIILIGERNTYFTFLNHDPHFNELFKVTVDFDEQIDRNKNTIKLYSRLIATIVQKEQLKPFNAAAVAALIDHSSRIAEDVKKLSTHIRRIRDLILESDYWASIEKKDIVDAKNVKKALSEGIHRIDRPRELYYEEIYRHFVIINTTGGAIGQVNSLSVVRVGRFSYGHPARITAMTRMGKGKVIDIQREIKMAGPSYSKGGLIIANFLAGKYNQHHTFSLYACLSFEQIYGQIDGDSASIAEVCALLSSLSDIPIKQTFAVTGSMDQYGNVQAVGRVNEKIEGFFDICKSNGLNGKHGVLIPSVNVQNLMLREDVVLAAKQKKFFVYPITTIDEAVTLLMGIHAGKKTNKGFPVNSINYKVEKKLIEFSKNVILDRKRLKKSK